MAQVTLTLTGPQCNSSSPFQANCSDPAPDPPLFAALGSTDLHEKQEGISDLSLVICFVASLVSVATFVGNFMVIAAFQRNKRLQTLTNYFIVSLACADALIGLVSMNLFTIYIVQGEWTLGPVLCDIWLCVDYVSSNASVLNLVAICLDRYFALSRPFSYRVRRTKKRCCAMIASAWLVSLVLWVPAILLWPIVEGKRTVKSNECYIQFIESNPIITICTTMVAFYVPVVLMGILSFKINAVGKRSTKYSRRFRNVRRHSSASRDSMAEDSRTVPRADEMQTASTLGGTRRNSCNDLPSLHCQLHRNILSTLNAVGRKRITARAGRQKTTRLLLVIFLVFAVTWAPYNVLVVLSSLCSSSCVNKTLWKLSYWLCYLNSTINPACYACCSPEFRKTFRQFCCRCCAFTSSSRETETR